MNDNNDIIKESISESVANLLEKHRLTLSTAESCTGGLLSCLITANPGSSRYYLGSVIAYSNELKTKLLGVSDSLITGYGAVSREVAEAMAEGIRSLTGSDVGIGITGLAGPDGGTAEKPVGLVYIAVYTDRDKFCAPFHLSGDRESVRRRAAFTALHQLLELLRCLSE